MQNNTQSAPGAQAFHAASGPDVPPELKQYTQFVLWRLEPDPNRPDKPRKVPYQARTGKKASPTDPATWTDHATALVAYLAQPDRWAGIGFVFSEADPFVFVDLDGCRDPATRGYSEHAEAIHNALPGAWEVSQSGTGLHGVGYADAARLAGKKRKWTDTGGAKNECYLNARFMAIGGTGWEGRIEQDWTEALETWVPDGGPANDADPVDWIDQVRPGYDGPADDAELIQQARASKGLSGFGNTASFEQLWTADPALGQFYPDTEQGRAFDQSGADLALCNALAWWTGCNPVRMMRLFRQSVLWRDDERKARLAIVKAISDPNRKYYSRAEAALNNDPKQQLDEILIAAEQKIWFAGCTLIGPRNVIVDGRGIEYGPGAFNAAFGGKRFIIDGTGKITDEAWKAATRSTLWTVPKVDGYAFRPDRPTGEIVTDELGRTAVNVYVPARVDRMAGDPSPFLDHLARVIPDEGDRRILVEWMAHVVRFPGHKIPWAPLIQSVEGVGKNALKYVLTHAIGAPYVYAPNVKELGGSGGKFNAWMERKLLLFADEIKTDDKRDLIEILKPLISERQIEIQGKGVDQIMGDNPAHWLFFTNHKDAIPKTINDRRYAVFFSAIQSESDLMAAGMDDAYFACLYDDFLGVGEHDKHKRGLQIVADYLLNHPIERGAIPMRSPATTSTAEAVEVGRGWLEQMISDAVDASEPGFRDGWINTAAVGRVLRENGKTTPSPATMTAAITALGFKKLGQAGCGYHQDDPQNPNKRGVLYHRDATVNLADYGRSQAYDATTL